MKPEQTKPTSQKPAKFKSSSLCVAQKSLAKNAALRPNLKANVVGKVIEQTTPDFPEVTNPDGSKSRRGYHYVTRGFILNEVRTLGHV